jgi:hypothetical protein
MAITKETKILGINDLRVIRVQNDNDAGFDVASTGGAPVGVVDIKGIQSLSLTPKFIEKDLRGDEVVLDRYTKLDSIDFSFSNAYLSLDALSTLLGGSVVAGGTGTAETQKYTLSGNSGIAGYFILEAQTLYTDAGDVHVRLYKCKINKFDYELKGEDYATVSVSGMAIPTQFAFGGAVGGKIKEVTINETATAISFVDLI